MTEKVKVELDGKIKCTKPLKLDQTLDSIREKIKEKIGDASFLDKDENIIDRGDETEFNLQDILLDSKIIKLKSSGTSGFEIKVFLNEKNICSKNCSKTDNLESFRQLLSNDIQENYLFLDEYGNEIDKEDEEGLNLEDVIKNNIIKLKSNNSITPNYITKKKELNNDNSPPIINENKESNKIKKTKDIKVQYDLSKYEEIKKSGDLVLYKYSKKERQSDHKLVYQYFYDDFDINDYKVAYVILFVGKTGDGKSTAINAFFNIAKGMTLEDKYRFILIEELKKEKGQAESQTDGVHLYYLRDYNNKPIIIIDSQGYGDTRGIEKDKEINDAFQYVFSNVIDHINAVGFIAKATNNRIDILTRYIFGCVTNLFAGDISENFIILATHAERNTIKVGPNFVETIQTDADFLKINEKMNEKWWYAFDSLSIFDSDTDKVTEFSFSQLKEFYEEKVKKLPPKDIKQTAEVLNERKELTIQVNKLSFTFQDLLVQQENLNNKEKAIEEDTKKISEMESTLRIKKEAIYQMKPEERLKAFNELNEEMNKEINKLNNEKIKERKKVLKNWDGTSTHCEKCKDNCHDPCDCWGSSLGRCTVFSFGIKFIAESTCSKCGCEKSNHHQDHYCYEYEEIERDKNNEEIISQKKTEYNQKKHKVQEQYEKEKKEKEALNAVLEELESKKKMFESQKEIKNKEKEKIKEELKKITKEIAIIIIKLQNTSQKLELIAMNKNHIKTEDEYIDNLKEQIKETGLKEEEQKKKLNKIKKNKKKKWKKMVEYLIITKIN